ncbi:MAG TPA: glycerate kinase [Streptosporangiaceae bacterium]|nr:glycerate kinase [Streptosporangiaceae bacterium]
MRIVVAPDKFKGSLTAAGVAAAVAAGLRSVAGDAEIVTLPVADGGDGTVDAAVAAGFKRVPVSAAGPRGEPVRASYARRGEVALVELACVCGLSRLPAGRRAPLTASSFGVGEVLRAALDAGARQVVLGVGGSASTDGGAGMLAALGARVLDARGEPAGPGGAGLSEVAVLDLAGLHPACHTAEFVLAADVDNPLTGPDGAAAVYGPQKGASPAEVAWLDAGLERWAAVVAAAVGKDWSRAPGAGAAGGVGFAAMAVLGARMRPGIELVLELTGLESRLAGADLVITGEGSLDAQSLAGKAPVGVARAAARHRVPVVAVAGRNTLTTAQLAAAGITAVYPLTDLEPDPARSHAEATGLLRQAGQMIARDWLAEVATRA